MSWAWAWGEFKKIHPTAQYKVYERDTEYGPVNYFTDGKTCWVKVAVSVDLNINADGSSNYLSHTEFLPVMDFRNKSIPLENVTSMDVNKAIQRCLTKAIARHGLGLYIYSGEDLPESEPSVCADCGREFKNYPKGISKEKWEAGCLSNRGRVLCPVCLEFAKKESLKNKEETANE